MTSVYKAQRIFTGDGYLQLTDAQTLRLKNYLIYVGLCDPILPRRFYGKVNEDTYLADLLGLHPERDGKAIDALPRIYTDAANICPFIVKGYRSLLLRDIDVKNIEVMDDNDEVNEALTDSVRAIFKRIDRGSFIAFMSSVIEAGLIYGDMFVALHRDATGRIWGYHKEAPSVFPIVEMTDAYKYVVNYQEYDSLHPNRPQEWSEVYEAGMTSVYYRRSLVPELSGETGIDEPAMAWSPLDSSRAELFGKSMVDIVVETIVANCGVLGSSIRCIRQTNGGITIFSGTDAVDAVGKALGGSNSQGTNTRPSTFDPDSPAIIAGENVTASRIEGNTGANVTPFIETLEQALILKCSLFALHKLGANASGKAIELTLGQLGAEIEVLRLGIEQLWTHMARIAMKLDGKAWPEGATVQANWGALFPPTEADTTNKLLMLYEKGIVPIEYVHRELGIADDELIASNLEALKAKTAPAPEAANPFANLFGG